MANSKVVKINYNDKTKSIALYSGIPVDDLLTILQTVFGVKDPILGFQDDDGLIIPVALACKDCNILPNKILTLLLNQSSSKIESNVTKKVDSSTNKKKSSQQQLDSQSIEGKETDKAVKNEIYKVIQQLHRNNTLTSKEAATLQQFLETDRSLLYAGYAVASHTNDTDYLIEVYREIAQSLQSEEGRLACEAQVEVLDIVEQLYLTKYINQNQLLYVKHLILIRDEEIANIYDTYQDDENINSLTKNLYTFITNQSDINITPNKSKSPQKESNSVESKQHILLKTISNIIKKNKLSSDEANKLFELIRTSDSKIIKAIELFEGVETTAEFENYLVDLVKDVKNNNISNIDEELQNLFKELKLTNKFENQIPKQFQLIIFSSVKDDLFTIDEANTICDLYISGYDMVKAAYEVYNVQNDYDDFIDTLKRIIRDLSKTSHNSSNFPKNYNDIPADSAEERKQKALLAVASAKTELLRHSVDMLVKQNILTSENGKNLLDRYYNQDKLIDAAIEAYATDRDVKEFLDTLYILANHSKEDLDAMLNYVQEDRNKTSTTNNTTSNNSNTSTNKKEEREFKSTENKIYIRQILIELVEQKIINTTIAAPILKLLELEDSRLYDIYEVFIETNDLKDFVDSIIRLSIHCNNSSASTSHNHNNNTNSPTKTSTSVSSSPSKDARFDESVDLDDDEESVEEPNNNNGNQSTSYQRKEPILTSDDQKSVLDILAKSKILSDNQVQYFRDLIDKKDFKIIDAFLLYEETKDVHKLISSLLDILGNIENRDSKDYQSTSSAETEKNIWTNGPKPKTDINDDYNDDADDDNDEDDGDDNADGDDDDNGENDDEDDEEVEDLDEEEEDTALDEDDKNSIEKRFLNIIHDMNLDNVETSALRLAIAKGDQGIQVALNNYRLSYDENELRNDLRNICKETIRQTRLESYGDNEDGNDEEENVDDEIDDEDYNDEDDDGDEADDEGEVLENDNYELDVDIYNSFNEEDKAFLRSRGWKPKEVVDIGSGSSSEVTDIRVKQKIDDTKWESELNRHLNSNQDNDDEDDDDDDIDDDNIDQQSSTSAFNSQAGRKQLFTMLIDELTKEGLMAKDENAVLVKEYQSGNVTINNALDLYEENSNMGELVESLLNTAKSAMK